MDTNLLITRGDTKIFLVTVKDSAGAAIDLTGSTIFFTAKKWLTDTQAAAVIKKTSLDIMQIEILDQVTDKGKLKIKMVEADTTSLGHTTLYYDIQVTTAGSMVYTVLSGNLSVVEDVTTG